MEYFCSSKSNGLHTVGLTIFNLNFFQTVNIYIKLMTILNIAIAKNSGTYYVESLMNRQ